ncbi:MAG TPA: peptide MFS transporter [Thermoanaerobaculia bacterium]|nr:peptide MFS transporter [Thermoanaerobaculia bacterium]
MSDVPIERHEWFGQPRGLSTLFFTEMWERFSYYGMRSMLFLFMVTAITAPNPGLGMSKLKAGAIYGLYTSLVYLLALPGGWVADKLWGQKKAVFVGGCIIATGHFTLALPWTETFYLGLVLIVIGTGLLKPNVSTIVGDLYPEGGARRDSGFSIFYMGINLGSFLGQIFCPLIGEKHHWHWGFSLAGFGMVLGLIQYKLGQRHLAGAGDLKTNDPPDVMSRRARTFYIVTIVALLLVGAFAYLGYTGVIPIGIDQVAQALGTAIIVLAILYFGYLFAAGGYNPTEKKRLVVIFWLFLLAALFWSGFEQAGSSMTYFAKELTNRVFFGWEMPAGMLQNVNAILIVIFAPIFGVLWTWLARRNANPSIPVKFALGLLALGVGFLVLAWGAMQATSAAKVSVGWLTVTYFFHTVGELCLSPVGLSSVTKLAPRDRISQMMGIWFVASALGNLFAGLMAGSLENLTPAALFIKVTIYIGVAGVIALALSPVVKRLMGGIE